MIILFGATHDDYARTQQFNESKVTKNFHSYTQYVHEMNVLKKWNLTPEQEAVVVKKLESKMKPVQRSIKDTQLDIQDSSTERPSEPLSERPSEPPSEPPPE